MSKLDPRELKEIKQLDDKKVDLTAQEQLAELEYKQLQEAQQSGLVNNIRLQERNCRERCNIF